MTWNRFLGAAAIAVLGCATGLSAQTGTSERKDKTKIEVKGGKEVTLTGCLQRSDGSTDYVLTDEIGRVKYAVVTDDDLGKYVDRRVEVKGRAANRGDGSVKIEHQTEGTSGGKTQAKVETKGDATVMPYLGLKSIKTVGSSCGA
jgi:hypothetical protein